MLQRIRESFISKVISALELPEMQPSCFQPAHKNGGSFDTNFSGGSGGELADMSSGSFRYSFVGYRKPVFLFSWNQRQFTYASTRNFGFGYSHVTKEERQYANDIAKRGRYKVSMQGRVYRTTGTIPAVE